MLDGLEPHWAWLATGLVLAIAEMLAPGVFLIWLAAAALLVGVITAVLPIGLPVQVAAFAGLALLSVVAGKRWLKRHPIDSPDPLLNRRGARLVGERVVVTQAIVDGVGRVRCGDTEWMAQGPDVSAGTRLTITGHDGPVLIVEDVP